jgi:hypothetical protein
MSIRKRVSDISIVPGRYISITWYSPVSKSLRNLRCTLCDDALGNRKWANAWIKEDKNKYSARLCYTCGKYAEDNDSKCKVLIGGVIKDE